MSKRPAESISRIVLHTTLGGRATADCGTGNLYVSSTRLNLNLGIHQNFTHLASKRREAVYFASRFWLGGAVGLWIFQSVRNAKTVILSPAQILVARERRFITKRGYAPIPTVVTT